MEHKITYPTWRYHKSEPAVIVNSEEEDKALGKGWHDAPVETEHKEEVESMPVHKLTKHLKDKKD